MSKVNLHPDAMPLLRLARVFHLGTMRPEHKGARGASYEGNGLSVSLYPQEWAQIARLGGQPLWTLEKADAAFLDYHGLGQTQRDALAAWGVEHGYLELALRWEVTYVDPETEDTRIMQFKTESEARTESDDIAEWAEDMRCEQVLRHCGTGQMTQRLGFSADDVDALSIVATFWVEDETTLDGVWWEDDLDVAALSAPRGAINCRALPSWRRSRTS